MWMTTIIRIVLYLQYASSFVLPPVRSRCAAVGSIGISMKNGGGGSNSTSTATMGDRIRDDMERSYKKPSYKPPNRKKTPPEDDNESTNPTYNWNNQWYPIHAVDTIDKSKPQKAYLLGTEMVIWYSASSDQWNVFEDSCPHRQGPLSEGRIEQSPEDGSSEILCSYHGWRFESETGSCSSLPYSMAGVRPKHEANCRARCGSFPTKVLHGLLFVFPQSGPDAALLAGLTPVTEISELVGDDGAPLENWRFKVPAGVRDFPCGWDTMVENTLDPAHFCAAHHGTLGNRYTDPKHYNQRVVKPIPRDATTNQPFVVDGEFGKLEFHPPCLVRYTPDNPAMPFGGKMTIATYCVPTRPGWVRPLAVVLLQDRPPLWWMQKNVQIAEIALEIFMNPLTPAWVGHVLSSIVLHQDSGILYYQHRNFQRKGYLTPNDGERPTSYRDLSYMPNESDLAVAMFRQWLQKSSAGADVTFDPRYRHDPTEKVDIFDFWHHTSQCKYCSDAYMRLERARKVAWVGFYGSVLVSPVLSTVGVGGGDGAMVVSPWTSLVVGVGSAAVALGLEKFNGFFRRYEVRHTDESIIDILPFFN